jgi:hypothetical protein
MAKGAIPKDMYLSNTAARAEISPMNEPAEGSFTSDWNFPAVLRCYLLRSRSCAGRGIWVPAGEPIPFQCRVAHGRAYTGG